MIMIIRYCIISSLFVAFFSLAGCYVRTGGPGLETEPGVVNRNAEVQTQLGIGYFREGKLSLALERLNKALQIDPNYSTAHYAMGLLQERIGNYQRAEEHFERAIEVAPNDAAAYTNFGGFLCRRGRYSEGEAHAITALNNPLYDRPELANATAGDCAIRSRNFDRAEIYFQASLRKSPFLSPALLGMAEINYKKREFLKARAFFQRFAERGPISPASLLLGVRIERAMGANDIAAEYITRLQNLFPDSKEAALLRKSS